MAELNDRVLAAAQKVPGVSLSPKEVMFWAHASLAYARDAFADRTPNRALRGLRPRRVDISIDRVHLVQQYQHPDRGYYTSDVVEEVTFG